MLFWFIQWSDGFLLCVAVEIPVVPRQYCSKCPCELTQGEESPELLSPHPPAHFCRYWKQPEWALIEACNWELCWALRVSFIFIVILRMLCLAFYLLNDLWNPSSSVTEVRPGPCSVLFWSEPCIRFVIEKQSLRCSRDGRQIFNRSEKSIAHLWTF